MMNDDDVVVARASGREAVEELRRSGALDALFERLDAGEVEMTGSQGLLPALLKEALERGLAAELGRGGDLPMRASSRWYPELIEVGESPQDWLSCSSPGKGRPLSAA